MRIHDWVCLKKKGTAKKQELKARKNKHCSGYAWHSLNETGLQNNLSVYGNENPRAPVKYFSFISRCPGTPRRLLVEPKAQLQSKKRAPREVLVARKIFLGRLTKIVPCHASSLRFCYDGLRMRGGIGDWTSPKLIDSHH